MKHKRFFELCERLSYKSNHGKFRIGAIIVEKSRVIGVGFNQVKTSPYSGHKFNMRHAEFNAILNTHREDLSGCELYVFRRGFDNKVRISKPCGSCHKFLKQMGIKKVYYSINDGFESYEI